MTPAEHLAAAEALLQEADHHIGPGEVQLALALASMAEGHALIALAVEQGAPHTTPAAGQAPSA